MLLERPMLSPKLSTSKKSRHSVATVTKDELICVSQKSLAHPSLLFVKFLYAAELVLVLIIAAILLTGR